MFHGKKYSYLSQYFSKASSFCLFLFFTKVSNVLMIIWMVWNNELEAYQCLLKKYIKYCVGGGHGVWIIQVGSQKWLVLEIGIVILLKLLFLWCLPVQKLGSTPFAISICYIGVTDWQYILYSYCPILFFIQYIGIYKRYWHKFSC